MNTHFATALEIGRQLVDPRGRCNRQGFLALAIALLCLQGLAAVALVASGNVVDSTLGLMLNAPLFWIGAMATLKRLHDMNRSGWWVPVALLGWIAAALVFAFVATYLVGPEAMIARGLAYWIVFGAITAPAFGALMWLHTSSGDPRSNRFGDVPGPLGFSPAPKREHAMPADAISA